MNPIPFHFECRDIRVLASGSSEPLFVGKDIYEALDYSNPNDAMRHAVG